MDAYIRGETSSLLVSPTPHSLAGKEAAEDPDTGRLVTAEEDMWGCSWKKRSFAKQNNTLTYVLLGQVTPDTPQPWLGSPHTPTTTEAGPKSRRGQLQINLQPSTSSQTGELTQKGNLIPHTEFHFSDIQPHFSDIPEITNSGISASTSFPPDTLLSQHSSSGTQGWRESLLPELMTLQWWPSTEVPSDTLAAVPTAWVSLDTGGASLPATFWFADQERQLPTGIQALGLLRPQLQSRGSLSPLPGKLSPGSGIASCTGGPGCAARRPQPCGAARSPCSLRHPPSASSSSGTRCLAPRRAGGPAAAHSRRDGSAQTAPLQHGAHGNPASASCAWTGQQTRHHPQGPGGTSVLLQLLAGGLEGEDSPVNAMIWSVLLRSSNRT